MTLTVFRTTYSSVLKDNVDNSTGFADAEGRLVAQGLTLPGHLGSVPTAMASIMQGSASVEGLFGLEHVVAGALSVAARRLNGTFEPRQ